MGTRRYIASKVLQALLTLAFVMVFNFFLFRVIPGDPAALLLRGTAAFNPQNVAAVTQGARPGQALAATVPRLRRRTP